MRLRDAPNDLFALIGSASDDRGIPSSHIEKDFWVVEVLRSIAQPLPGGRVVFKGGTSLSKAFGLIDRFSEDIDILFVAEAGSSKRKVHQRMKTICERVETDLGCTGVVVGSTTGVKRYVRYPYPIAYPSVAVTEGVLLEMGVRGGPDPSSSEKVRSYVAEYALSIGETEDAYQEFGPVELPVLRPERTVVEKLALVHDLAVRHESAGQFVADKGRHVYDIYALLGDPTVRMALSEPGFVARMADDRAKRSAEFGLPSTPRPSDGFGASPAFDSEHECQAQWQAAYERALPLIWGDRPSWNDCLRRVQEYRDIL